VDAEGQGQGLEVRPGDDAEIWDLRQSRGGIPAFQMARRLGTQYG